jgi:hypothetical protein
MKGASDCYLAVCEEAPIMEAGVVIQQLDVSRLKERLQVDLRRSRQLVEKSHGLLLLATATLIKLDCHDHRRRGTGI